MSKRSRGDALDDISAWDTEGVLCLLRKVSEASHAILHVVRNGAAEGKSRAGNFAADTDCQRRDAHRDNVREHTAARGGERRRQDARRTCASKVVNAKYL